MDTSSCHYCSRHGRWVGRVDRLLSFSSLYRPVVGITAAMHGNELNGVPCIHRVITDIDVNKLKGTVVAIPCGSVLLILFAFIL